MFHKKFNADDKKRGIKEAQNYWYINRWAKGGGKIWKLIFVYDQIWWISCTNKIVMI